MRFTNGSRDKLHFYIYGRQVNGARTGYWFRYLAEEIDADAAKREGLLQRRYRLPGTDLSPATGEQAPVSALKKGAQEAEQDCG